MGKTIRSAWIWAVSTATIILWCPVMAVVRLFDRDPVRIRTGKLFRRLGTTLVRLNPTWRVEMRGEERKRDDTGYVVVSNHQSYADIPFLSHVPWEMKWLGKKALFTTPVTGWMMRMAGDIELDRTSPRSGIRALKRAAWYLEWGCSVMIFPEGTRSKDGRVHDFLDGAFRLAVDTGAQILPIAVDGTFSCLPRNTWKFGDASTVQIQVLDPVDTRGKGRQDISDLKQQVRVSIARQIAEWRGAELADVLAEVSTTRFARDRE